MIKKIILLAVVLSFAFSTAIMAQSEPGVRLEFKGGVGSKNAYGVLMQGKSIVESAGQSQSTDMKMEMVIEQKVLQSNGTEMDVSTTIVSGSTAINNEVSELPNVGQAILMKMNKRGAVIEASGGGDPNFDFKQMQIEFPERKVKNGDTWTSKIKPNEKFPIPMEAIYTMVGTEMVQGYECAKIESEIRVLPSDRKNIDLEVDAKGVLYFAVKEGKMVKNEVRSKMIMKMTIEAPEYPQPVIVNMTMNLDMEMKLKE